MSPYTVTEVPVSVEEVVVLQESNGRLTCYGQDDADDDGKPLVASMVGVTILERFDFERYLHKLF